MSWGRLPWGLRERPFDVYAAVLLFITGLYVLLSADIPGSTDYLWANVVANIIAIYYIVASSIIISALLKSPHKCPAYVLFGEMYGWAFVAAASTATWIMYLGSLYWVTPYSWLSWSSWLFVWIMLSIASGVRSFDLISKYREMKP
jgi:hypothetical protein